MTWVGLDGEVKGSARRRKSGRTEESNQINIIIHWWGPPFTLQHTQVFYRNILVKWGNKGKQSGEPCKPVKCLKIFLKKLQNFEYLCLMRRAISSRKLCGEYIVEMFSVQIVGFKI